MLPRKLINFNQPSSPGKTWKSLKVLTLDLKKTKESNLTLRRATEARKKAKPAIAKIVSGLSLGN